MPYNWRVPYNWWIPYSLCVPCNESIFNFWKGVYLLIRPPPYRWGISCNCFSNTDCMINTELKRNNTNELLASTSEFSSIKRSNVGHWGEGNLLLWLANACGSLQYLKFSLSYINQVSWKVINCCRGSLSLLSSVLCCLRKVVCALFRSVCQWKCMLCSHTTMLYNNGHKFLKDLLFIIILLGNRLLQKLKGGLILKRVKF